ncbi:MULTISPECIES: hypothetical protein [unclassified Streptomyces]|uniref:hypothetical protein n=1 Tax=unclassified Streptomyces TaxID=2593676 RepID=UPI003824C660
MPVDEGGAVVAAPVTGYRLILPEEWAHVPLREGTEDAVRGILDEAFGRIPADSPPDSVGPFKRELERRLRGVVEQVRESGALDLYLPVRSVGDVNLGASVVVSETLLPRRDEQAPPVEPTDVAVQLLSRDRATHPGAGTDTDTGAEVDLSSGELDGALAVRREHVVAADPRRGAELASRRVEYVVAVPGDPGRWFTAAFSTVGGGDPRDELADALVEWFDAVMATLRWRRA